MKRSVKRNGVALMAVTPVALWFSSWRIEEARYSPFTLEYQKRQSLVVFTGEIPLYRSSWEPAASEVLSFIQKANFVEPLPNAEPRWQLVHRFKTGHGGGWSRPFHCLNPRLVEWSERHPDLAPTLWRLGFKLVRSEVENEVDAGYTLLGELWQQCNSEPSLCFNLLMLDAVFKTEALKDAPANIRAHKPPPQQAKKGGRGGPPGAGRGGNPIPRGGGRPQGPPMQGQPKSLPPRA